VLGISVVYDCLINELGNFIEKKTAIVETEDGEIQMPRRNECACLHQNNFET
jgi:hypothetical protein